MTSRSLRKGLFMILYCVAAAVSAGGASAQLTQIYATYGPEDQGPGGPIGLGSVGPTAIHLWAWGGPLVSSGPPCNTGAMGHEICGVSFTLVATGGFQILSFVANPNFDSSGEALAFKTTPLPGTTFTAQNFDLGVPMISNRYLGSIVVIGSGITTSSLIDVSGQVVRSNLELGDVLPGTILVPEPGLLGSLAAGALGLALCAQRSARRRSSEERAMSEWQGSL